MLERGVSGLPIVDSGKAIVGIVTEGDLVTREASGHPLKDKEPRKRFRNISWMVGDVMRR